MSTRTATCSTCILLNIRCDTACVSYGECRARDVKLHEHPAPLIRRFSCIETGCLSYGLDHAFESAIQIDHSKWVFPQRRGALILEMDYSSLGQTTIDNHAILDLPRLQRPNLESAHLQFLHQFSTIESRWGDAYELLTEDIFMHAASYQKCLLSQEDDFASFDEKLVILNALRCFVNAHDVCLIASNVPQGTKFDDYWPEHTIIRSATNDAGWRGNNRFECSPRITVDYKSPDPHETGYNTSTIDHSSTLCGLLSTTINSAESLLLRRRPRDWPTIFYVLYILEFTKFDIAALEILSPALRDVVDIFDDAIQTLCGLFLLCTGNSFHPMSIEFDIEWYSMMVGSAEKTIQEDHYRFLNECWKDLQHEFLDLYSVENFLYKLDRFV